MTKADVQRLEVFAQAQELKIQLPEKTTKKKLWSRYHLDIGAIECECPDDTEECECGDTLFYNSDLRSMCGMLDEDRDPSGLILWPKYYAKGWEQTYFKKLIQDALQVTVSRK